MQPSPFVFSDFIAYVRHPQYTTTEQPDGSWPDRIRLMWLLFWPKFVIGFSLAIVMFLVQKLVVHYTGLTFERDDYDRGWSLVLTVVVVAPLIEEGLFRGLLKPRAGQLTVVTFLLMACVVGHNYGEWPVRKLIQLPVAVGLLVGVPLLVYRLLRLPRRMAWLQRFWQAHFRLIFYVVAIGFGLIHLGNYQELTGWHYLMAPLLTLPQLFAGFYLGYVRMTYGIWYSIALHAIWNVMPASLTIVHLLTH